MTEYEKQEAKKGFQSANAKYMGLDAEPMTGTGEKGDWRKVKVRFLIEGKEKENKFVLWTPIKTDKSKYKSDEELNQFEMYNIVWVEKEENFEDKEWVSKTICIINDPKEETNTEQKQQPQTKSEQKFQVSLNLPTSEQLKEFSTQYVNNVPKEEQGVSDFIGAMLRTFNQQADVLQDYVEYYKNDVKQ